MSHQLRPALVMLLLLTLITGVIYPLAVTGIAQLVFPAQANGSIIFEDGEPVGSELIGQQFDAPEYFWGRLSATGAFPYNAFNAETLTGSSGSNYGPLNPALLEMVQARIDALRGRGPVEHRVHPGRPGYGVRRAAWTRTSASPPRTTRCTASRKPGAFKMPPSEPWWTSTRRDDSSSSLASRG